MATYLFINTLLLGRSSSWCTLGCPLLPCVRCWADSRRPTAIPQPMHPGFEQLSSEGMLMPSNYPSEGWRSGPMPPVVVLQT